MLNGSIGGRKEYCHADCGSDRAAEARCWVMDPKQSQVQVPKEHYKESYDSLIRFISYFYQVDLTIKTNPKNVLEVGTGNRTVYNYLKTFGLDVTSCDIDPELEPDKVADVRELPFEDEAFDTVIAFEILEHIPFSDFQKALLELRRVSRRHVIISIPYSCASLGFAWGLSLPRFKRIMQLCLRIPFFFLGMTWKGSKDHEWEMGRKGYPKRKIRGIIRKYFKIRKEFHPVLNSYHYFWVLEKFRGHDT